jgi:hypothetical protein
MPQVLFVLASCIVAPLWALYNLWNQNDMTGWAIVSVFPFAVIVVAAWLYSCYRFQFHTSWIAPAVGIGWIVVAMVLIWRQEELVPAQPKSFMNIRVVQTSWEGDELQCVLAVTNHSNAQAITISLREGTRLFVDNPEPFRPVSAVAEGQPPGPQADEAEFPCPPGSAVRVALRFANIDRGQMRIRRLIVKLMGAGFTSFDDVPIPYQEAKAPA